MSFAPRCTRRTRCCLVLLGVSLVAGACRSAPEPRRYELNGQILSIAPERREVVIRHEDIKGFMPGMTMPFIVDEPALLDGRQPGDLVTATLVVGESSAHLSTLTKTGYAPVEESTAGSRTPILRAGDVVTDEPLVDQDGAARPLASFRGHRVALTFVYTRCPIPDFCPLMNRNFAAIQKATLADPALADVRLVTVTLDPEYDRPPVLEAHARLFAADPARWFFLTGEPEAVARFSAQFGVDAAADERDPSQIVHNLRTAVIGPDGRFVNAHTGNDWTPAQIIADLKATAAPAN